MDVGTSVMDAGDAEEAMYTRDPRALQALEKIHNPRGATDVPRLLLSDVGVC